MCWMRNASGVCLAEEHVGDMALFPAFPFCLLQIMFLPHSFSPYVLFKYSLSCLKVNVDLKGKIKICLQSVNYLFVQEQ